MTRHVMIPAMNEILTSADGKTFVANVARAFKLDTGQADAAVRNLSDALTSRIERNMLSRAGVADMTKLLIRPEPAGDASDDRGDETAATAQGNKILDVLIGSKHASRGLAARAARDAGIEPATAEDILPVVANAIIGALQKNSRPALQKLAEGIDTGGPLSPPGEPSQQTGGGATKGRRDYGKPLPIPGDIPRSNRGVRQSPERVPQQDTGQDEGGDSGEDGQQDDGPPSPYDRLPDIIRRGGTPAPGGGGTIEDVIRNILGNLLGNQGRGVVATMIQLFIVRFLASLVRRFFGRVTGR